MQRFLRCKDVTLATGLSTSSIYDLIAENKFPKPVPLEGRRVAWLETEIDAWQKGRIAERDRRVEAAIEENATESATAL